MRNWIMTTTAMVGIGIVAGVAIHVNQKKATPPLATESANDPSIVQQSVPIQSEATITPRRHRPVQVSATATNGVPTSAESGQAARGRTTTTDAKPAAAGTVLVNQAVESLASPQSSFAQRQEALEQLRKAGKLDQAMSELEQRMADDPRSAECPAALGRLYLQKCGTIQDVREQGILAMKADQVFDAALNLDPSNWEARFTKALAMSYWPTQMNKGTEVMQHFVTLVGQQEAQPPQPHFAQTYAWLGDTYQKYGYADHAKQVWARGAALFPENQELRTKLLGR